MGKTKETDTFSNRESQRRFQRALRGALEMPPKPHAKIAGNKPLTKSGQRKKQGGPAVKHDHPEES